MADENKPAVRRRRKTPKWLRAGDDTFAIGTVPPEVAELTVEHLALSGQLVDGDASIAVATLTAPVASPVAFYVVELPGWCFVTIEASDGTAVASLGQFGPLPSDAAHAECLAE